METVATGSGSGNRVVALIGRARLLPVVRVDDPGAAVERGHALLDAGHPLVELTATIPDWDRALERLRGERPDAVVGLGTVTTAETARRALDAGAAFLVSPHPAPEGTEVAAAAGVPFVEGGFTPDQVARAAARGVAKLWPAHIGGLAYLRSLLTVMPGARIVPSGGVSPAEAPAWLAAGACAVSGSELARGDVAAARVEALGAS